MAKKKQKDTIRISKKDLNKWAKIGATLLVLLLICYGFYSFYDFLRQKRVDEIVTARNIYCNTTWQDYINGEVVAQMTEYNATNCKCFYENIYTADQLASMCLCSCELYDLNGTLITDDFRPLFSSFQ